jgi:hypothetical protein
MMEAQRRDSSSSYQARTENGHPSSSSSSRRLLVLLRVLLQYPGVGSQLLLGAPLLLLWQLSATAARSHSKAKMLRTRSAA